MIQLFRRAATDADAAVLRGGKGHPHEDPPRHQRVENRFGEDTIAATVERDEIGGRGEGAEPVFFGDLGDPAARLGDLSLNLFR